MTHSLSAAAESLWAKSGRGDGSWISLRAHMEASAQVASESLWAWLSARVRAILGRGLGPDTAWQLFVFLAAAHDLGKATPLFQFNPHVRVGGFSAAMGLPLPAITGRDWRNVKHSLASQAILERFGVDRSVAVAVGGHHGIHPSKAEVQAAAGNAYAEILGCASAPWAVVQRELYAYALALSGLDEDRLKGIRLSLAQQMLYTGIVILADWLASDEDAPSLPARWAVADSAAGRGYGDFNFGPSEFGARSAFNSRFGFAANAMQSAVIEALPSASRLGITVIEGPMGSGKTEAALAAAEIAAGKAGCSGVCFALPTQATADGVFLRFTEWIKTVGGTEARSVFLAHGKSVYNREYAQLRRCNVGADDDSADEDGGVYVNEWLTGRKKGLLSDFAVGTIDQLLLCALRRRHTALRHLGLANKVVIIDEVHAYDAYMGSYLYKALRWLGAYGVPTIVLSATLPPDTRQKLIENYTGKAFCEPEKATGFRPKARAADARPPDWVLEKAYPLITYTDGKEVKQLRPAVDAKRAMQAKIVRYDASAAAVCEKLDELLADGGCAGIIINTVARAQEMAKALFERFGGDCVLLLHAGFISLDRSVKEAYLLKSLGPHGTAERRGKLIAVGTQVIEQSLDISFDVLFTEICPMDLLLQRIGRLHRHRRARPARLEFPLCHVRGCNAFDGGSTAVYGKYALMTTRYLLSDSLCLPEDISRLVRAAYGGNVEAPEEERAEYKAAKEEHEERIKSKTIRAERFQLTDPTTGESDLTGASDGEAPGESDEATVRDSGHSIEVILLRQVDEVYRLLPWIDGGKALPAQSAPDLDAAFTLAGCKVRLPWVFSESSAFDRTICELKEGGKALREAWKSSPWLRGELFLVLDADLKTTLCGRTIAYDRRFGLIVGRHPAAEV
ncbi:MAG: CRISPR-associated helicase Cas3' [Clostridiales Family XIII bacterium]|jgi:CRISPR-associated endonuclease/helicase Cas3|nr:CRISPR-associated helicase Cas3' [Clostridiales Family XIII bacterium]